MGNITKILKTHYTIDTQKNKKIYIECSIVAKLAMIESREIYVHKLSVKY